MKIIGLEEHWATPEIIDAWAALPAELQDDSLGVLSRYGIGERIVETADERLNKMDEVGVDVQVLSLTVPGLHNFAPEQSVAMARHANDAMAAAIAANPSRYQGFAALPTPDPEQAAAELERAVTILGFQGALVHGRTRERNMDAPEFEPIYAMAAKLKVPIYLHPQLPVRAVRDAYYSGFSKPLEIHFANGGFGWHVEAGIQFLRLILNGTFDRYPDLQFILGHWGEVVLFYLDRVQTLDVSVKLDRPVRDYFLGNGYYTPSGILSQRDLQRVVETVGAERVMFSTDYPFEYSVEERLDPEIRGKWVNISDLRHGGARRFLEEANLTQADKELIAHGNWERLASLRAGS